MITHEWIQAKPRPCQPHHFQSALSEDHTVSDQSDELRDRAHGESSSQFKSQPRMDSSHTSTFNPLISFASSVYCIFMTFHVRRFEEVRDHVITDRSLRQKLLVGAYFSLEYSLEAAALFNPSIVPHPDQSGLRGHVAICAESTCDR